MSRSERRDDFLGYRLSSFLYRSGGVNVNKINKIKPHVYYIDTTDNEQYIVKGHKKEQSVLQQWLFFKQLDADIVTPFVPFPNGRKIIKHNDYYWTLTPYVSGRKLHFNNPQDRQRALDVVRDFHQTATGIYIKNPVRRRNFHLRWYNRLQYFIQTESLFSTNGYDKLFNDIKINTEYFIYVLNQYPWSRAQERAKQNGTWVHGDVASHNFILGQKVQIIDFDLLLNTDQIYDYIQLGQRFLPHIRWDLDQLLDYRMVDEKDIKRWLIGVFIPSDLIREWLYYLRRQPDKSSVNYLQEMEEQWINRKILLKNMKTML